jgi:plasmid stabilization system protein ParE
MTGFQLAPQAARDIVEIWDHIAWNTSIQAAERIQGEIFSTIRTLARSPGIGHRRVDLTPRDVLFFTVHSWLIIYQPKADALYIHAVVHGARDVAAILDKRIPE